MNYASESERREHSKLGPSGADRWTTCAGSVRAEEGRDDRSSVYAAAGTLYHEIAAECIQHDLDPYAYVGREYEIEGHEFVVDESYARHIANAMDRIYELAEGGRLFVETRVSIAPFTLPGQFGTTDIAIAHVPRKLLIIWDHKWGEGVTVEAKENKQGILYALGFWEDIGYLLFAGIPPEEITVQIIIDQPRARIHIPDEEDGEPDYIGDGEEEELGDPRVWETTLDKLLGWAPYFRERAEATLDPDAPRTPSKKGCTFCKAKSDCAALAKFNLDLLRMELDDVQSAAEVGAGPPPPPDPRTLSVEARVFIAQNKDFFLRWIRDIHESVLADYLRGVPTPGVKAVRGRRGPRMWSNVSAATKKVVGLLGQSRAFEPRKLLSPNKVEMEVGKAAYKDAGLADLATQSEGRVSLVDESDPRDAITPVSQLIDVVEEEE